MKIIGYVRVSTDKQAEHGVSLEAQEAKIRAMATVQGTELAEVIVDGGESARSLNRPGMTKLLALADAEVSEHLSKSKIQASGARQRMLPVLERSDAVIYEACGTAPYRDVTTFDDQATHRIGAAFAAP